MKKRNLFLYAVLAMVCVFASCKGKAGDGNVDMVGRWVFQGVMPEVETSDPAATAAIKASVIEESAKAALNSPDFVMEFTKEGKLNNGMGEEGTYTVSGNHVTMMFGSISDNSVGVVRGDSLLLMHSVTEGTFEALRQQVGIADDVKLHKVIFNALFVRQK